MRTRRYPLWAPLAAAALLGCAGGDRDVESLRDGLAALPRDTVVAAETAAPAVLPDTTAFPGASVPADTLPPTAGEALRPRLRPPVEARDTRPWIPLERHELAGPGEWSPQTREERRPGAPPATLTQVRFARNPDFDRVVFRFAGDELPGYQVEYVDRPVRQCGSGDPVTVAGDATLLVRLTPARAHDDRGRVTVRERSAQLRELPLLEEIQLVCDFEGVVEWALGVRSPNHFRVLELREPSRLVVDVRH